MNAFLTEDQKNNLVIEHKQIIYYMANKYRWYDNDRDEIIGWCFFGMANAIAKYEKDTSQEFSKIAFREISKALSSEYLKYARKKKELIFDEPLKDDDGDLTIGTLKETDSYPFGQEDIFWMIDEALFEEAPINKEISIDYLFEDKSINEISNERNIRLTDVKRVARRCIELLRLYLLNNDIISEYLLYPDDKEYKTKKYKKIDNVERGKIKYLNKVYPFLRVYDIAMILNIETYKVSAVSEYPTTSYIRAIPDAKIDERAKEYCRQHYPEREPRKVKIFKKREINKKEIQKLTL